LTAILVADVAGYSRLMHADDEGTVARLKAHRNTLVDPQIAEHNGRIVKTTGDGLLVEFLSAVDALRCAIAIQEGMAARNADIAPDDRVEFRIGINFGDILIDGDNIFGEGVSIAERLESIAEPGGICVSGRVREDAERALGLTFEDAGIQTFPGAARPVQVFRVAGPARNNEERGASKPLALPDKPSIAVLPFQNMSGDAEQDYFADGIVEDIITALARNRWLFVIARNSSFTYKGPAVDVKRVGRELGVRYVLEGSVRNIAKRVRITGQLIDAATGAHLWADYFDGSLDDIFELQDRVTAMVVGQIAPKVEQIEIQRARQKPTESLDSYDCYLRGLASARQHTKEEVDEALRWFNKAIELDPDFAAAYSRAAGCYVLYISHGQALTSADIAECKRLAQRGAELGKDDAVALAVSGITLATAAGAVEDGADLLDQALRVNANLATAWQFRGWVSILEGNPGVAIEQIETAIRLSPLDPLIHSAQAALAAAHFFAGHFDQAATWAEKSCREKRNFVHAIRFAAASHAAAGRMESAASAMSKLREIEPGLRLSNLHKSFPLRRPEDVELWQSALRRAGLPE
jgi:TolB-like protein/class 3 adenylate cyclase